MKDDVAPENRALLYMDFLMAAMSGDVVELPVGGAIRRKASQSSRSADMARLQTLADLLGMSQVHRQLACRRGKGGPYLMLWAHICAQMEVMSVQGERKTLLSHHSNIQ